MSVVVGRSRELGAVGALLGDVSAGPAVLVLEGPAGIGKTVVWRAGVDQARERDLAALVCQPTAFDVRLSYAGLSDLLAGAGFLSLLDALTSAGPVLLAIDDVQWLDEPSRRVVEYAVRRCDGPLGVLLARRDAEPGGSTADLRPRDPARLRRVAVGPLSLGALHHVLREHLQRTFPRPVLVRIAEVSGGNPFFALELARSADVAAPGPIDLPGSLQAATRERLGRLPEPVGDALRIVAALGSPQLEVVERVLADGSAIERLGVAEDAGVIEPARSGAVRFAHPLLAVGLIAAIAPSRRRALHRRLSLVVDDREERARHLALAAVRRDPEVIDALDAGAAQARRRGAPGTAAELLELAIGLGADDASRCLQAAHDHFEAGDPGRARQLLEAATAALPPGPPRARALAQLGSMRFDEDGDGAAAAILEQAISEAGPDPALGCSIRVDLSFVLFVSGRIPEALDTAAKAIGEGERAGDAGLLAEALASSVIVGFLSGAGLDEAALARALELEDPDRRTSVKR